MKEEEDKEKIETGKRKKGGNTNSKKEKKRVG
jgi:hypothetical protein